VSEATEAPESEVPEPEPEDLELWEVYLGEVESGL